MKRPCQYVSLSVEDIERLMVAMTRHRVSVVAVGDVRLVKRIHEATTVRSFRPATEEDQEDEADTLASLGAIPAGEV